MPTILVTRTVAIGLTANVLLLFKLPFWPGRRAVPWLNLMGIYKRHSEMSPAPQTRNVTKGADGSKA